MLVLLCDTMNFTYHVILPLGLDERANHDLVFIPRVPCSVEVKVMRSTVQTLHHWELALSKCRK